MYASILKYFEKVFSSHEIHARKPEQEAYKTVLNYLQLNPDKVIFLDDNTEYVQAASEMNIASIHVTSFKQMVEDLSKLGVEVKSTV
jgi:putative hydrolase of the HAD superfamily